MKPTLEETLQAAANNARTTSHKAFKGPVTSILSICMVAGIAATIASFSQTSDSTPKVELNTVTPRTLTSSDGKTMIARLVDKTAEGVEVIRLSDGRRMNIPLDRLCAADQQFIRAWAPPVIEKAQPLETINTPEKVFLALPFDKQDRGGICTAAALLNVIQYIDPTIKLGQRELFSLFNDGRSGANYPQIQAALLTLGYESEQLKFGGKDDDLIIQSLKKFLSQNIPALVANSGHMITVLGFDSTNPDKKTITIWDQRDPEENATDLESIGVVNMDENQFSRRFRTLILIKPKQEILLEGNLKTNLEKIGVHANAKIVVYKFTPPTSEPDTEKYLDHALEARILVELRRGNRVFVQDTKDSLCEITRAPDSKNRDRMWGAINSSGKAIPLHNSTVKGYIEKNNGVFYSVMDKKEPKPDTEKVATIE